jgi:hypothetical protein
MKNLGKVLTAIIIFSTTLFALDAKINPSVVHEGDQVSLIITSNGKNIKFPRLDEIAGYKIENQYISRNITSINGKTTRTLTKEYVFVPKKSFVIPSIEVEVDGKTEKTEPISVELKKGSLGGNLFTLTMEVDKTEAFIGEAINVEFIFKFHRNTQLAEASFSAPAFNNFWAKPMQKQAATIEGEFQIHRIKYLLFAQKEGPIEIEAGRMDVGIMQKRTRNMLSFERVKWKTIYSKSTTIDAKPLPKGVNIYGNFKFFAKVDKQKTKTNEPINLTITIKGVGNIDDIDEFKLDIRDAIVYADKPEKKIYTNNKNELGEFTQKFAIVSDRNFAIPPLEFIFFDGESEKVVKLTSEQFDIEVEQAILKTKTAKLEKQSETSVVTKTEVVYDSASKTMLTLFALGGFLLGLLTHFLLTKDAKMKKKKNSDTPFEKRIKKSKNDKELLALLLPYTGRSKKLQDAINGLEENIYQGKNHIIDKADLAKNIKKYLEKEKDVEDILK